MVVKQTVSLMVLSRKASPLTNLCASCTWARSSYDLDERLGPRLCVMLESRSPQLLDEGGELRIARRQCSPAKCYGAVDIASHLKNYRLLTELTIRKNRSRGGWRSSGRQLAKIQPFALQCTFTFFEQLCHLQRLRQTRKTRINLFSFILIPVPSAVTRRSYNKITYHHNDCGYNDNYHNCNFTRYSHLHF